MKHSKDLTKGVHKELKKAKKVVSEKPTKAESKLVKPGPASTKPAPNSIEHAAAPEKPAVNKVAVKEPVSTKHEAKKTLADL